MMRLIYALLLLFHPLVQVGVTGVVDGDTIDTTAGRVRILGVNAPERGERCYGESKEFLKSLLGSSVKLERDFIGKDRYGRLLRYVHANVSIPLEMVRKGYAKAYCIFPNYRYRSELEEAQARAMNEGKGCLWKPSNNSCLRISEVSRDGEWVRIMNHCPWEASLEGVYVESDGRQREQFHGKLCPGCEDWKSLRMGRFVMLFDSFGFIDFRGA